MTDGHGDDLFRFGDKIKINFSTNIPQRVDHSGLMRHLAKVGAIFSNYPEPEPVSEERRIAQCLGVEASNVIVTNGATEAIYLLAHAFMGSHAAIAAPAFREYQDACRIFSHSVRFISALDEIGCHDDTVWLCNPNNPTGLAYNRGYLLQTIDAYPTALFVVDQAYAGFCVKEVLSVSDVMARDNVVMLHSLTKQFVVPGLRIGYAIGPSKLMARLRTLRMPWSVNAIAIEAAHYLLAHASDYLVDAYALHAEADRLAHELRVLGMAVADTDCNFLLAELPCGNAAELKRWLIDHHGMLVREASNFEGLTPRHFRVAAQSREENTQLIKALKGWIACTR